MMCPYLLISINELLISIIPFIDINKYGLNVKTAAHKLMTKGEIVKNNGTRTFAAAIANISDHVHAPKQARPTAASMNEHSDCTSWRPEVAQISQRGLGRSPGSQAQRMCASC